LSLCASASSYPKGATLYKVFVATGDDGMLRVFRGDTLGLLDFIKLETRGEESEKNLYTRSSKARREIFAL
jgi:hypothetical protein